MTGAVNSRVWQIPLGLASRSSLRKCSSQVSIARLLIAKIDEVMPKTKLEFGPDLRCSPPEPGTSLLKRRPPKGCEKALLSLDEVFRLMTTPMYSDLFAPSKPSLNSVDYPSTPSG
jgi:hypothetical protein